MAFVVARKVLPEGNFDENRNFSKTFQMAPGLIETTVDLEIEVSDRRVSRTLNNMNHTNGKSENRKPNMKSGMVHQVFFRGAHTLAKRTCRRGVGMNRFIAIGHTVIPDASQAVPDAIWSTPLLPERRKTARTKKIGVPIFS